MFRNTKESEATNEALLRLKAELGETYLAILLARRASREVVPAGSCTPDTIVANAMGIKGLLNLVKAQLQSIVPESRGDLNAPLLDLVALGLTPEEATACRHEQTLRITQR